MEILVGGKIFKKTDREIRHLYVPQVPVVISFVGGHVHVLRDKEWSQAVAMC